jgi:hypothetical protein
MTGMPEAAELTTPGKLVVDGTSHLARALEFVETELRAEGGGESAIPENRLPATATISQLDMHDKADLHACFPSLFCAFLSMRSNQDQAPYLEHDHRLAKYGIIRRL